MGLATSAGPFFVRGGALPTFVTIVDIAGVADVVGIAPGTRVGYWCAVLAIPVPGVDILPAPGTGKWCWWRINGVAVPGAMPATVFGGGRFGGSRFATAGSDTWA